MGFDWYYLVLVVPAMLLALWAQFKVNSTFRRYAQVPSLRQLTGAQAAETVLRQNGVTGVRIACTTASIASSACDARPRLVCSTVPVRLITGRSALCDSRSSRALASCAQSSHHAGSACVSRIASLASSSM